ncbi:MAG TPA: hypothetical protein VFE51_25000 [Verrucomicrobiae bacterium]|nr:hypothetical protein [Verrucomicrobiae bacterium]
MADRSVGQFPIKEGAIKSERVAVGLENKIARNRLGCSPLTDKLIHWPVAALPIWPENPQPVYRNSRLRGQKLAGPFPLERRRLDQKNPNAGAS